MRLSAPKNFYEAVYLVTAALPRGQVAAYGSIATWLGAPRAARAVGYALAANLGSAVPWHRVVNSQGGVSEGGAPGRAELQRKRLRAEGLRLSAEGKLPLAQHHYAPTAAERRRWLAMGERIRALRKL